MLDFSKTREATTMIAVTGERSRKFVKVTASEAWLKSRKATDNDEARAVMAEHAHKLLRLKDLVGQTKIETSSMHFGVTDIDGAIPLIPGSGTLQATSNYCCICNDANPPQCACVPC